MYAFVVPGPPFGKPAVAQDRHGRRYRPAEVTQYYARVAWMARSAEGYRAARAPLIVITAIKARPKRKPRDYPLLWSKGRNPCLTTPDADNIAKTCLDGLKVAGAFKDDGNVAALTVYTFYAAEGEDPHVHIAVSDLAEGGEHVAE